jgi:hypothetical protein
MKFRKKPVVIEAFLWEGSTRSKEFGDWHHKTATSGVPSTMFSTPSTGELIIPTLEGDMTAQLGDYIICGVKGEFYPCKPDIFEATYEKVEE